MKRTLAFLALLLAVSASSVSAGPVKPPAKPKQTYPYCLGFINPTKCFELPACVGEKVDRYVLRIKRVGME